MQQIAAWTNLSETTFFLPPTDPNADYRLRIFTPRNELPFAGHPTLGSAHAVIQAGLATPKNGTLIQECRAGLIPISVAEIGAVSTLQLEMPTASFTDLTDDVKARLEGILGVPLSAPSIVDVGPKWIVAGLKDAQTVTALTPNFAQMAALESELGVTGVSIYGPYSSGDIAVEVRSFAPSSGIDEDPVCGSGNGSVAAYRFRNGEFADGATYQAAQGRCVGRDGKITLKADNGNIYVGGQAITTIDGTIT